MKYKKKPVVINAFKWTGHMLQNNPEWITEAIEEEKVYFVVIDAGDIIMKIETLEGTHTAERGDYIIQGVKGELYPCKPDIFELTYEEVTE